MNQSTAIHLPEFWQTLLRYANLKIEIISADENTLHTRLHYPPRQPCLVTYTKHADEKLDIRVVYENSKIGDDYLYTTFTLDTRGDNANYYNAFNIPILSNLQLTGKLIVKDGKLTSELEHRCLPRGRNQLQSEDKAIQRVIAKLSHSTDFSHYLRYMSGEAGFRNDVINYSITTPLYHHAFLFFSSDLGIVISNPKTGEYRIIDIDPVTLDRQQREVMIKAYHAMAALLLGDNVFKHRDDFTRFLASPFFTKKLLSLYGEKQDIKNKDGEVIGLRLRGSAEHPLFDSSTPPYGMLNNNSTSSSLNPFQPSPDRHRIMDIVLNAEGASMTFAGEQYGNKEVGYFFKDKGSHRRVAYPEGEDWLFFYYEIYRAINNMLKEVVKEENHKQAKKLVKDLKLKLGGDKAQYLSFFNDLSGMGKYSPDPYVFHDGIPPWNEYRQIAGLEEGQYIAVTYHYTKVDQDDDDPETEEEGEIHETQDLYFTVLTKPVVGENAWQYDKLIPLRIYPWVTDLSSVNVISSYPSSDGNNHTDSGNQCYFDYQEGMDIFEAMKQAMLVMKPGTYTTPAGRTLETYLDIEGNPLDTGFDVYRDTTIVYAICSLNDETGHEQAFGVYFNIGKAIFHRTVEKTIVGHLLLTISVENSQQLRKQWRNENQTMGYNEGSFSVMIPLKNFKEVSLTEQVNQAIQRNLFIVDTLINYHLERNKLNP